MGLLQKKICDSLFVSVITGAKKQLCLSKNQKEYKQLNCPKLYGQHKKES